MKEDLYALWIITKMTVPVGLAVMLPWWLMS